MNSYPVENVWTDRLSLSQLMETGDLGEATAHAQWLAQAEQRYVQDYVTTRHQQVAEIAAPEVPRHQQRARSQLVQVRQHWLQLKMMRLQIWSCWKITTSIKLNCWNTQKDHEFCQSLSQFSKKIIWDLAEIISYKLHSKQNFFQ